ncbi:BTAD domain-containing putative transcriptional regulator [Dactylosporangium sp. NPDC049525]|uniref:AfsR/SARP family transcriptional regulator n=1 Tax=Dactylosporangium sp. NPDC049525 TaxID=3154730 RepID=UPI003426D76E
MPIAFRVLGDVGLEIDGCPVDVGPARQRHVLAALLIDANRPVPLDHLLDRVWGDCPPQRARGTLHSYLSRLRGALADAGGADIRRGPAGYVLGVDPMTVDLHRFRCLIDRARSSDDDAAAALFAEALASWHGEAFPTLDTPWFNATREGLHRLRLAAELDRNDLALRQGRHTEVLDALTAAAGVYLWDERLAGQLILALYRSGRQAEALETYDRLRRRLAEALGTDPGPPLRRLHRQILTDDPDVSGPPPPAGRAGPGTRAAPLQVPRQLPAPPGSFIGRSDELAQLAKSMDARSDETAAMVISAVVGAGGIGKTWLALRWANDNTDRFPDGQLYANLRGFDPAGDPVDASTVLRRFLEALGVEQARIPVDSDARAGLYRSLVAGRRLLVVLDNARDSATVAQLLPGTATSAVLVTSRSQLPGLVTGHDARPLALDVLPEADARTLLAQHVGAERITADPAATAAILEHCAGLPLALGILAARAALHPDLPLATLAAEVRTAATRLDALDAGELTVDLRAVLSCSQRALDPPAATAFVLLGLAPGPDLSEAAAASLIATPPARTRHLLRRLIGAHLVQEHQPGRYRMHDLVRLHAYETAVADPSARGRPALRRLLDHYLHTAHHAAMLLSPQRDPLTLAPAGPGVVPADLTDLDGAMAWFATEHAVLLAAARRAAADGFDVHAWQLPWTLATYFDRRGHWDDWAAMQQTALDAAARLGNRAAQAQAHRLLANALSNLQRYDEAHAQLQCALDLFDGLGDDAGRAHTNFDIAMQFDRQGDPRTALTYANESLRLYRAAGTTLEQAVALNAVGWYHCQLGEHRPAVALCTQALALTQQAGSLYGQANTWDSLGYAHHHLGEHDHAVRCYGEALALFRRMGDRHAEAIVLDHIGDTHSAAGSRASAHRCWLDAVEIFEQLGHPDVATVRSKMR